MQLRGDLEMGAGQDDAKYTSGALSSVQNLRYGTLDYRVDDCACRIYLSQSPRNACRRPC